MSHNYKKLIKDPQYRHVLGISGGKDSAALAIYIKEQHPEAHEKVEYFFTDTGAELEEVYDFLAKLEAYLGKEIIRLSSGKPFEHWLKVHNEYLPSPQQRWCTRMMKIKPFEAFVGDERDALGLVSTAAADRGCDGGAGRMRARAVWGALFYGCFDRQRAWVVDRFAGCTRAFGGSAGGLVLEAGCE